MLLISLEQYLASLRAKLKIKNVGPQVKGTRKTAKIPILDLEHAEPGDDDFDEGLGVMEKERKCLEQLQTKLSRCQRCGPDVACKIDLSGEHVKLNNNQLRAWANSMVLSFPLLMSVRAHVKIIQALGSHGVTLVTPPHSEMFGKFFKNSHRANSTSSVPQSTFSQYPPPYMPMHPYAQMMPWGMLYGGSPSTPMTPTLLPRAADPQASSSKLPAAFLSSDPPEIDAINPYPEITDFLKELHHLAPQRNLLRYIPAFECLDFYHIDEISKLGPAEELVRLAHDLEDPDEHVSIGNAKHIMEKVKAQIKRIDRAQKAPV